jgi:ABC-type branched-subunit amino acid transport system substrate-binding protein
MRRALDGVRRRVAEAGVAARRVGGVRARAALAAGGLVAVAVGASVAAGDLGADRGGREFRAPGDLASLLTTSGAVVVGKEGKPLLGPDGEALRVAPDGKTLLDSQGRPLRDKAGKPLKLGADGTVPASALGDGDSGGSRGRGRGRAETTPRSRPRRRARTPVTAKDAVVVGVAYNNAARLNEIFARYGGNARASDGGADTRAVANHINSTGGIDGRKLVLRLREYDTTDGRPYDVTFAEVCTWFGEGTKPVAVITIANDDELAPCLANKGIPLINDWPTAGTAPFQARYANFFFQPGSLNLDRFARPYVNGLKEQGFFGSGARVGLLRYSDALTDAAVDSSLRPALAAAGVQIVAEQAVPYTTSVNDIGGLLTRASSAGVRFRAAGVNRVISVDNTGQLLGLFLQAADAQGYHPRVGLSSLNSPLFLRASLPTRALQGAVGVGWSPVTDVAGGQDPDVNATRSQCSEIFQRAGVTQIGDRSAYGQFGAFSRCSNLLMLRKALERRDATSPAALRAALEGLGTSHQSAVAMETSLGPGRHDGANAYRLLRFADGCGCFEYRGGRRDAG